MMILNNNKLVSRILIIGGAGFIGIHTAALLKENGHEVALVDDFSTSSKDKLSENYNLYIIDASILIDLDDVYNNFLPDVVYIFSSVVDVPTTIHSPLSIRSGVLSLMNALQLCVKYEVKSVFFASSGYVYGNKNILPYTEKSDCDPVNPYNISKIFNENLLNFYSSKFGLNIAILRYAPTYGPRRKIGPIMDFIDKARTNMPITLFGSVTRDYIFVEDVAYANLCALRSDLKGVNVFNIGTGVEVSLQDVYFMICKILNIDPLEIIKNNSNSNEINRFVLDVKKAKNELNFISLHTLEKGLIKTIKWIEDNDN